MPSTLTPTDTAASATGVRIRILLNARSFGDTSYDLSVDFVDAYSYSDRSHPADATDQDILNTQFTMFNDQTPSVHADLYYAAGHRSLSSGDVVGLDNRFYRCDNFGWTLLDSTLPDADASATALPPRCAVAGLGAKRQLAPLSLTLPEAGAVTVLARADATGDVDWESLLAALLRRSCDLDAAADLESAVAYF
ncbi:MULTISPECIES: hypothetical protein [Nocardia]|uniref:hypothetical protein n=1 Tax=Nocardia TaxID=1817 RepID=UPI000D69A607|nr:MULTISPECIES: hypothetical protein [Nocardia]